MKRYSPEIKAEVRRLRALGKTYSEISGEMGINFSKGTLCEFCKLVLLPPDYDAKIKKLNQRSIRVAWEVNKQKRDAFLRGLDLSNESVSKVISQKDTAKIALAMLCLGEASKYSTGKRSFSLGSSDPRIIVLFLELLKKCFDFHIEKTRATVQCRADQDTLALKKYWQKQTGIPNRLFYKALVDPRTVGKPTKKKNYMGVLRIDYFDTKVHLELESLAQLIYNQVQGARRSPVG